MTVIDIDGGGKGWWRGGVTAEVTGIGASTRGTGNTLLLNWLPVAWMCSLNEN